MGCLKIWFSDTARWTYFAPFLPVSDHDHECIMFPKHGIYHIIGPIKSRYNPSISHYIPNVFPFIDAYSYICYISIFR